MKPSKDILNTTLAALVFLVVALIVSVVAATAFGVPSTDLLAVGMLLAGVGGGCGVIALIVLRPAVLGRLGGVRAQLIGAGLTGSFLTLGMMLGGARAMFLSGHDFAVVLTMLTFAAVLSVGFSLLCAGPLASRVERVRAGTARVADGSLDQEVPVEGRDEISGLAEDFNRMARSLKEAADREQELERGRRELIAAISHDLRTPLSSVRALVEALSDGVAASDPETEKRYLASAGKEIEHLSQLVDDLFELARIDAGMLKLTLEEASLHDMISDTIASFQPQAKSRGVRLVGEVAEDVDPVLMNPPRLQRVLHNLVSNALRHTPTDGTVALRAIPSGPEVEVEVADTGEGITPEDLPHVFEHSFRGEKSRTRPEETNTPGAGLGLAIARGLIEAHGGRIQAHSNPGEGSSFRFTLLRPQRTREELIDSGSPL